jgi:hypothetical protein
VLVLATNTSNSNFFAPLVEVLVILVTFNSNFGQNAGYNATGASNSNFFGYQSGQVATGATNSNFFGQC